jgi:putative endopeptidase
MKKFSMCAALALVIGATPLFAQTNAPARQASRPHVDRALQRSNLDTACAACEDFYSFANGGWLKTAKIPPSYPSYGSFEALNDRNEEILHGILDTLSRDMRGLPDRQPQTGTNAYRVASYYDACVDTVQIEKLGTAPVDAALKRIASIASRADLIAAIGQLEHTDGLAPYGIGVGPDFKNSDRLIAYAGQGGLNLPDRDYYLTPQYQKIRDGYVAHIERMFELLGDAPDSAKAHAQTVMAMETKFAEASMDRVTMRDPTAIYHMMTLAAFDSMTPNLHWKEFLAAQHAPVVTEVNVAQPDFYKAMNGFVGDLPVEDWKTLLRWRLINTRASLLPKRFVNENFSFAKQLTGQQELLPRWKNCTSNTDQALGEALGQEYVARVFTPAAKARAKAIVDNMVTVLGEQIGQLEWMAPATKKEALGKLQILRRKIGYPDKWIDYGALDVVPGQYVETQRRVEQFNNARDWKKVGKPVDKSEWGMSPPTVNAYYNPTWNEIVFPAGILLPPFFDANADDAVNYGAMGAVIGHEMTHGFDDSGRRFDAKGNLRDWWTPEDASKFDAEAQKVVDQFNAYTVVDTATHVNGKLTLGENIADLGGLKVAYIAMERAMAKNGRPKPIDGFTAEQRFFLGWAQVWRSLDRPEYIKMIVASNPHSPSKWRVNGPLSNMDEFKSAWGCKDSDPMVRPAALRAHIW